MSEVLNEKPKYDLEERTAKFGETIINFVKTLKITPINRRIIDQLVGSYGSVGANYCEATKAESKKDFIHKIGISKKEIKETKHWLRLFGISDKEYKVGIDKIMKEAHELLLIFSKIKRTASERKIDN